MDKKYKPNFPHHIAYPFGYNKLDSYISPLALHQKDDTIHRGFGKGISVCSPPCSGV